MIEGHIRVISYFSTSAHVRMRERSLFILSNDVNKFTHSIHSSFLGFGYDRFVGIVLSIVFVTIVTIFLVRIVFVDVVTIFLY
jgi:hypothetical protein